MKKLDFENLTKLEKSVSIFYNEGTLAEMHLENLKLCGFQTHAVGINDLMKKGLRLVIPWAIKVGRGKLE